MLESDNPAIFTSGVSKWQLTHLFSNKLNLWLFHLSHLPRSLWTTSRSKLWMRLRHGTMRSSSWKTASESYMTCSWTWPCWWRARWKHLCGLRFRQNKKLNSVISLNSVQIQMGGIRGRDMNPVFKVSCSWKFKLTRVRVQRHSAHEVKSITTGVCSRNCGFTRSC